MRIAHTDHKNNSFSQTTKFEFGNRVFEQKGPLVMGILNLTPDSFYDGGMYHDEKSILDRAIALLSEGADIIDLGAVSTRPGATMTDEATEIIRLLPVVKRLKTEFPSAILSIDTFRTNVAKTMLDAGATMINDISGGTFDATMAGFIGETNAPYVMMHIFREPETMQNKPMGVESVDEIFRFFDRQVELFMSKGAKQLIIDPGIGFGKTVELNYYLLAHLDRFTKYGFPILVGLSRKSLINKVLRTSPEDALNGTTVLNTLALMHGANILRVHDVKEAVEARTLCAMIMKQS